MWQEFLNNLKQEEVPGFPIWAMEFGADYPYQGKAPIHQPLKDFKKYKGTFGESIQTHSLDEALSCLPIYAQTDQEEFPQWKKTYIKSNREFYAKHKKWLDKWIPKIREFENSHQKFEWNCGTKTPLIISDKILQFRPSGIRVKLPNFSPALVLTTTQIPIFPWLGRYMTTREAAKLQCMQTFENINLKKAA